MERIEDTILRNLLYNEEFARKTLPFIKDEYFSVYTDKTIFNEIYKYFDKFSNLLIAPNAVAVCGSITN